MRPSLKMISPSEYSGAVALTRYLVSPIRITNNVDEVPQQLTIVELRVVQATDKEIEMSFYCPSNTTSMNKIFDALERVMPIDEAMDAWGCKVPSGYEADSIHTPITMKEFTDNSSLSEFTHQVVLKIPKGPVTVTAAWSHPILPKGLLVPTQNETLQGWNMETIVIGADTTPYGRSQKRPLNRSLRWDIMASKCNVFFPGNLDDATLVVQRSGALPFHNLWFPLTRRNAMMREYITVCGSEIHDNTSLHLVTYYDVGFQAVMAVAGCVIRDGFNFTNPNVHIPFTITERMTRCLGPLIWSDGPEGSHTVVGKIGNKIVVVDILDREKYGGVTWVTAKLMM